MSKKYETEIQFDAVDVNTFFQNMLNYELIM